MDYLPRSNIVSDEEATKIARGVLGVYRAGQFQLTADGVLL